MLLDLGFMLEVEVVLLDFEGLKHVLLGLFRVLSLGVDGFGGLY